MGTQIFLGKPPANIEQWIIDHYGPEPGPTAPDGKVLYRTTAGGDWLEDDADISDGTFNGFATVDKTTVVEVIIPSKDSSGNDVMDIGAGTFYYCDKLTNVIIPDSVMNIRSQAFHSCISLTSMTIGNSVTSIGEMAFEGCSGLTSMTIGSRVTSIGHETFAGCRELTSVTFNSFTKDEVKSMTTNDYIFGYRFSGEDWNPMEKSFTVICTDGSMTVHFSANSPATITVTDL